MEENFFRELELELNYYKYDSEKSMFLSEYTNSVIIPDLIKITNHLSKNNIYFEILDNQCIKILEDKEK